MISSMTGFGRGESSDQYYKFQVEIKTVNHRYNDIYINMPNHLKFLEDKIKKTVRSYILRGRVEVYINLEYSEGNSPNIKVNTALAKSYYESLKLLKEELSIKNPISLEDMLQFSDVFKVEKQDIDENLVWKTLEHGIKSALEQVNEMRIREGKSLKKDIVDNIVLLERYLNELEKLSFIVVGEYKKKLEERIENILNTGVELDQDKLSNEVAFLADKSDINEELVRLESHLTQLKESLCEDGAIGRRLDFIVQEMNREINTIGSKSSDVEISKYVVEFKTIVEKIREQVQNIQ